MFEKLLAHRAHIPPHRIWAFLSAAVELAQPEHVHLMQCGECRKFHDIWLQCESFAEALGIWVNHEQSGTQQ
jgi:hypothetical protein